jgi:outer membrane protein assembly factor BamB
MAAIQLTCCDLETGKPAPVADATTLNQWTAIGSPLPAGDLLYLPALKRGASLDLYVLAVEASQGRLLWSTRIGAYRYDTSQQPLREAQPALVLDGTRLYLDTDAGAAAEIDAATGALRWAYLAELKPPRVSPDFLTPPLAPAVHASAPLVRDGLLYFKSMWPSRLYAIRPAQRSLAWSRPIPPGCTPIATRITTS